MNLRPDDSARAAASAAGNAEARLEQSRARLQQRLGRERHEAQSGAPGPIGALARSATPAARRWVRAHPSASLFAAALTGVALARLKPWRGVGGSLLAGLLARQALALARSSGGRVFDWLLGFALGTPAQARHPAEDSAIVPRR